MIYSLKKVDFAVFFNVTCLCFIYGQNMLLPPETPSCMLVGHETTYCMLVGQHSPIRVVFCSRTLFGIAGAGWISFAEIGEVFTTFLCSLIPHGVGAFLTGPRSNPPMCTRPSFIAGSVGIPIMPAKPSHHARAAVPSTQMAQGLSAALGQQTGGGGLGWSKCTPSISL